MTRSVLVLLALLGCGGPREARTPETSGSEAMRGKNISNSAKPNNAPPAIARSLASAAPSGACLVKIAPIEVAALIAPAVALRMLPPFRLNFFCVLRSFREIFCVSARTISVELRKSSRNISCICLANRSSSTKTSSS